MLKKKICLVGSYAVGKTSLIGRFVKGIFSEDYLTTVGVKIDRKNVNVDGVEVLMLVWDLAGEDEFERLRTAYLKGAAGILYVVDGSRAETLEHTKNHMREIEAQFPNMPGILLVNKFDLVDAWELDKEKLRQVPAGIEVMKTSAKTGENVELAFLKLAKMVL